MRASPRLLSWAAPALVATMLGCSTDSEVREPMDGAPTNAVAENAITWVLAEGLAVTTKPVDADPRSAVVSLVTARSTCWSRTLTPKEGAVTLESDCEGNKVSLDLQFISPDGPCHNGGLYLVRGSATLSSGRTVLFEALDLAGWNSVGLSVPTNMTPAPYDAPALLDQSTASAWVPGTPLPGIGRWMYTVRWGVLAPVPECSVVSRVSLTLQPPARGAGPRIFEYRVEQKHVGDDLLSSVTSSSADAPPLIIGPTGKPRIGEIGLANISFVPLEILGAASASLSVSYEMPAQVAEVARSTFSEPALASVDRLEEISMTASATPQPLAAHLGAFLETVTAPGAPSSAVNIAMTVNLVTPVADGFSSSVPLLRIPQYAFTVGVDGKSNCAAQATKSFACALATGLAAATPPAGPGASYSVELSILGGATGETRRAMHLANVTLPLALVSPEP